MSEPWVLVVVVVGIVCGALLGVGLVGQGRGSPAGWLAEPEGDDA